MGKSERDFGTAADERLTGILAAEAMLDAQFVENALNGLHIMGRNERQFVCQVIYQIIGFSAQELL